jgi:parallel beta-helix repeat protein
MNLRVVNGALTIGIPSLDLFNKKFHVTSANQLFKQNTDQSLSSWYILRFPSDTDVFHLIDEYSDNPHLVHVEPNWLYHFCDTDKMTTIPSQGLNVHDTEPNDPLYNQQWALPKIDAPNAWDIEKGDPSITIAILDTGADYNHADLADNIWNNTDEIAGNGIDDDSNGFIDDVKGWDFFNSDNAPVDDYGHGTHCAGIVAAVTNNNIGVAGLCWNCKIMPVKIGDESRLSIVNASEGLVYAADNGANVISMSWSGGSSELIKDALAYAYGRGVVLIAAAGNDNSNAGIYPALYDNVIAVAATDSNDTRAVFSNFGSWVDVAAPGVDILSLRANGTDIYGDGASIVNEKYLIASGTSMSCPYVAGLAALLLSKNTQCPYPAQMIQSMIPFTTDTLDTDEYIGTGRINASKALQQESFVAILDSIPNWEDAKGTINIQGAAWGETFQYFTIEYGLGVHPSTWMEVLTSYTPQSGVLTSLDTTQLDEGLYTIHLTVVCDHGIYTDETSLYVNNKADGSYIADVFVSNCYTDTTSGWGTDHFATIQGGINHSKPGDTIFVYDGIYIENISLESESRNIIGQNKNWTILDGTILILASSDTRISEFTIRLDTMDDLITILDSERCTILNTSINPGILSTGISIILSSYCTIEGNFISGFITGIAGSYGIVAEQSFHLNISKNTMMNHAFGIELSHCDSSVLYKNIITRCDASIVLLKVRKNLITKNLMDNSTFGMVFYFRSSSNKIIENNVINNIFGIFAIFMRRPFNNYFYYNNFMNVVNAFIKGFNVWYKSDDLFKGQGNYWSDYVGVDANDDGIGDTPYRVSRGNVDRYPLMQPYG